MHECVCTATTASPYIHNYTHFCKIKNSKEIETLTMNTQRFTFKQRDFRRTVVRLASISCLIVGDVCQNCYFSWNGFICCSRNGVYLQIIGRKNCLLQPLYLVIKTATAASVAAVSNGSTNTIAAPFYIYYKLLGILKNAVQQKINSNQVIILNDWHVSIKIMENARRLRLRTNFQCDK